MTVYFDNYSLIDYLAMMWLNLTIVARKVSTRPLTVLTISVIT